MPRNKFLIILAIAGVSISLYAAPRGSGTSTSNSIGSPAQSLYLINAREDPGYVTDTSSSVNSNMTIISSAIANLETLSGNTNYIQLRPTLQSGATFYVSSASVDGQTLLARTSGNVGIATASPTGLFVIGGGTFAAFSNGQVRIGTTSQNTAILFHVVGDSKGNAQMRVQSPLDKSAQLDVRNPVAISVFGVEPSIGGSVLTGSLSSATVLSATSNTPLQLGTNDTPRMTILGTGNVGIGTASPTQLFHVAGNLLASSATVNGTITSTTGFVGPGSSLTSLPGNSTSYIQNTGSIQTGSTFYVSVATVAGQTNLAVTSGNVGVGIVTPTQKLHVSGRLLVTGRADLDTGGGGELHVGTTTPSGGEYVTFYHNGADQEDIKLANNEGSAGLVANNNTFFLQNPHGTNRLVVDGNGNVGIGTVSPGFMFVTTGTAAFPGIAAGAAGDTDACLNSTTNELTDAGASTCIVSSRRFKKNINPLNTGLAEVLKLKPVEFVYKNDLANKKHLGLIAEDMESVEPRLVFYEPDGKTPRGIEFELLTALLVKSIQDLNTKINVLEARIVVLEAK